MKIIPNQLFKHAGKVYEEGTEYDADETLAFYFKTLGWLGDKPATANASVDLTIHDGEHGHEAEVK